jgi:hypothetical protein
MAAESKYEGLKKVLDVADRLGRLRQRLSEKGDADGRAGRTVRAESRRVVHEVNTDLESGAVPGALAKLHRRHRFDDDQLTILLLLLQRRIQEAGRSLTGRELLSFLHESSYDRLRGLRHLAPDGPLRRSGIVEVDASGSQDLLDAQVRIAENVFRAIERDVTPEIRKSRSRSESRGTKPYGDHREHLLDLARLSRLYQRRARRVFESEEPDETLNRSAVRRLQRDIRRLRGRIEARLALTAGSEQFPVERVAREHRLDEDEALVLVTLLFQEIYAGSSYIEPIELVKMISRSDLDLMDRRRLFAPDGRLLRSGLVKMNDEDGELLRLGGEAYLPPETVEMLLAGPSPVGPIDADVRLEWHEYLDGLEDSDEFFRRI